MPFGRYLLAGMLIWSALVGISLYWNIHQIERQVEFLATQEARANWNKDQAFRRWATRHGGLYVRPDERTPPNPYLAHLPDRDVVTTDGMKLTLMNPAYMMRQMTEEFEEMYGVKGSITGQILLNPINRPDPWELQALKRFDQGETEIVEVTRMEDGAYLRLMRPMVMRKGCVKCHGHLGFKEGDIRGGVSVSIPLAPYQLAAAETLEPVAITHGAVWLLGLAGIGYGMRRVRRAEEARYRSQLSLMKSDREWSDAMDFFEDAVCLMDGSGCVIRANRAFCRLFDSDPQTIKGRSIVRLLHSGGGKDTCPVCTALEERRDVTITLEADQPGNPTGRPAEIVVRVITDEQGMSAGILLGIHDLSRTRKVEAEIFEREQQIRDLLESTAEAIYGQDLERRCTFANPACVRMLGYTGEQELLGRNMHRLIHHSRADGSPYAEDECPISRVIETGEGAHVDDEVLWRADGSSFSAEYWSYPIRRDGRVIGSVVTFLDITERKNTEEALRRSQKMEAIGQLSGGIAHDFNNRLGVIIGYLDFLKDYAADDAQASKWVETATRATLRCMDLTRKLLTFSRHQGRRKEVVDLNAVLRELETMIARSLTPEVEMAFSLADDLWPTEIDPGDFQDAILNLAINARDAMPDGGRLLIETSNLHLDAGHAGFNPDAEPGDYVQLALSDTGIGMDRHTLEHIFDPFFTTKHEGKGTGLGMAMVYGFVKSYGGHIKVCSETGVGTTIRMYLPRSRADRPGPPASDPATAEPPRGVESILIVDDESDLLALAENYLSGLGYRTHTADNAEQALKILQSGVGVDLLFSDVVMPGGMNGYELAQKATWLRPGLRVLLTSGFTSRTIAHSGLARFASHLLGKPYRRDDLARRVRVVLDEKRPSSTAGMESPPRTLLVVDDEVELRDLFQIHLGKLGYEVLLAADGEEALRLYRDAQARGAAIAAVIVDLGLPGGMDGREVARRLRELDPRVRLIVSSGHSEGPEMTRYREYGFDGAMEKNFDRQGMREVLDRVL